METTVPTLCDYPGTVVTLYCLCKTSSAPCLAPALNLGQGVQGRNGPISCRAGFLHSSLLQHNFTMSVLQLVGACVDTWKSQCCQTALERGRSCRLMFRALPSLKELGVFPTLVQGRGCFLVGCIPPPLGLLSSFAPLVSQTEVTAVSTV